MATDGPIVAIGEKKPEASRVCVGWIGTGSLMAKRKRSSQVPWARQPLSGYLNV